MTVVFTSDGWRDYQSWVTERKVAVQRDRLIEEALRTPGEVIGKPERLKGDVSGSWSRRIDQEHRLVHVVDGDTITNVQCRYRG